MKWICLLIACFCGVSVHAQKFPKLVFQKFYGAEENDVPAALIKTTEGKLVMGGMIQKENEQCSNIWIVMVDTSGQLIWEQEIAIGGCQELRGLSPTPDGGVMFSGVSSTLINHREKGDKQFWSDVYVGRLDKKGNIEWMQTYGGTSQDQGYAVSKERFNAYMIAGGSHSRDGDVEYTNGMSDVWLLRIDKEGKKLHSRTQGGRRNDWAHSICTTSDEGYAIAGFTNSPRPNERGISVYGNGLIMKLRAAGSLAWQKTFPCPYGGYLSAIQEDDIGNIWAVGHQYTADKGAQFWVVKLDGAGNVLMNRVFGEQADEYLNSMNLCDDGGFLLGGYAESANIQSRYNKGKQDFWLLKMSRQGKIIWQKTYGGPDHERCVGVVEYAEGLYFALGEKRNDFMPNNDDRNKDFWLLRIEEEGCKAIEPGIFVRAKEFKTVRGMPVRFRARYEFGERFQWDFGDGTKSDEEDPLKTFEVPGMYKVTLTVFMNENCKAQTRLEKILEVR